jgi:hypothetical protein
MPNTTAKSLVSSPGPAEERHFLKTAIWRAAERIAGNEPLQPVLSVENKLVILVPIFFHSFNLKDWAEADAQDNCPTFYPGENKETLLFQVPTVLSSFDFLGLPHLGACSVFVHVCY